MSQSTTNYGFTKPELTDVPDITVLSKNWEMIDSILKSIDMRNKITIVYDSTDVNSYATRGIYFLNNASNVPSEGKSGLLFVEPWSDSLAVLQFWVERTTHEIYLRVKDYSWGAWSQISTHAYFEEFSTELQTTVQSTLSAFNIRIQDNYDYIDTVATALREQIGNTLVTDTISSSLDTSKAYVYVGTSTSTIDKGDWIYYDGTEWKSGGVYNSEGYQTDKILTVSDMAADAKVVGDKITDLKRAIINDNEDGITTFALYGDFKNGSLTDGVFSDSIKYRVATDTLMTFDRNFILSIKSGFRLGVHIFSNGVFSADSGWRTNAYPITAGSLFKIVISRTTEDTSEVANIKEFVDAITFNTVVGDLLGDLLEAQNDFDIIKRETSSGEYKITSSIIGQGAITNAGWDSENDKRIRTNSYIPINSGLTVKFKPGVKIGQFAYNLYDKNKTHVGQYAWYTDSVKISTDGYIRFLFATTDGSTTISPSDFDAEISLYTDYKKESLNVEEWIGSIGEETPGYISLARYGMFVNGCYAFPTFTENRSQVTTRNPIIAPHDLYMKIDDGYKANLYSISGDTATGSTGWQQDCIYVPKDKKFTFIIEKTSHAQDYEADISEHVNAVKVYDDSANPWYEAKDHADWFLSGQNVDYETGALSSTNGYWHMYQFKNPKFKRIKVWSSNYGRSVADIAFYSSETPSAGSYMADASSQPGSWTEEHWTYGDVPEGCKLVCVCSRNKTNADASHEIKIYIDDISNMVDKESVERHPALNFFTDYYYIYHFSADRLGESDIPLNSPADIEMAYRLGFKAYEINAHPTATAGKYICLHGSSGKIGTELIHVGGTSVSDTNIDGVTYAEYQENYRYKTSNSKYQTPPLGLDDALRMCKKYGMIPVVSWGNYEMMDLIRDICGERYVLIIYSTWYLNRALHKSMYNYYGALSAGDLDSLLEQIKAPFMYCITETQANNLTDGELIELANICHRRGCLIGSAGVYQSPVINEKLQYLGFDYQSTGWEVEQFNDGNVVHLVDNGNFNKFSTNGTVSSGILTISSGQYLRSAIPQSEYPLIGKCSLRIKFSGSIKLTLCAYLYNQTVESTGDREIVFTSAFYDLDPNFYITADSSTQIYSCSFDVSSC